MSTAPLCVEFCSFLFILYFNFVYKKKDVIMNNIRVHSSACTSISDFAMHACAHTCTCTSTCTLGRLQLEGSHERRKD